MSDTDFITHGDTVEIASGETVRVGIDGDFRVVESGAEPPDARVVERFRYVGQDFSIIWQPRNDKR